MQPSPTRLDEPRSGDGARHRWGFAAALLLVILASVPYLNSLHGDFVFDDLGVVRDNPVIHTGSFREIATAVHQPGSLHRPLTMLTYAANAHVSTDPFGFHAVNSLLHVAVTLALYALFVGLVAAPGAAWIAAALFAVHPIHTEAVASIVGRAELLAALAVIVSLLALRRAVTDPARFRLWLGAALVAFALGLGSKESAFTVIGLVPVIHWWAAPDDTTRRRVVVVSLYLSVGLAYLASRALIVGSLALPTLPDPLDNPLAHVDLATRLRTAAIVLWDYLSVLVVPLRLSADYSFNQVPLAVRWSDPRVVAAFALLLTVAAAALAAARRLSVLTLATLFFAVPLALTANVLFPIGTIKAERLLYLPSAGFCLAAGWLLARWAALRPRAATVAVVATLALFAGRTWARNADWRDARSLFGSAVAVAPRSAKAHYNLAVALQHDGVVADALAHYHEALTIYPAYAAAAFGIGHLAALQGDDEAALPWLERAIRSDPGLTAAHTQLGLLLQRRGNYAAAEAALRVALVERPDDPLLLVNLAATRLAQGDRSQARELLDRLDRAPPPADARTGDLVAAARNELEVAMR